jgi:hypothetical protein
MCKCNKGLQANKSPLVSSAFASNDGNFRYSNDDFIVRYYVGESGLYTGSATKIEYGYRTYNKKTMVHVDDYQSDGHLFSEVEQSENIPNEQTELVTDIVIEEVPVTRSKRSSTKKEVEENVEKTV